MKYDWFNIAEEDRNKWEAICPAGEYRVIQATVLSGVLPDALINKFNSVFVMGSGTPYGNVYYMANGNRVDDRDAAIDQMPFGLAFVGDYPVPSGCLIQHGDWQNRTIHPPQEFWDHVIASGTASYYPLSEMPSDNAGKITDLKIDSQNEAFGRLVEVMKDQVGE